MRISVYKLPDGRLDVMVEAAQGHGKPPVVLQRVTKESLRTDLPPVMEAQKGRRPPAEGKR